MLPQDTFQRIDIVRFPLIVGVVIAHACPGTLSSPINIFIYNFICNGLVRIIVPMLFLISGYLFFIKFGLSEQTYLSKFQSRIRTLLIPFLFWNITTLLTFSLAQTLSATSGYFTGVNAPIANYGVFDYFNAILGIERMPIAMQFWFIRDLMLLVLLAPVIQFFIKRVPLLFLITLYICWMLDYWPVYMPAVEPMMFFSAGAFMGARKDNIFVLDKYGIYMIPFYFVILLFTSLFAENPLTPYLHRSGIMLGIVSAMSISKYVIKLKRVKNKLLELSSISFFVFAAHEPLQVIIRKFAYKIFIPESWVSELVLYFVIPVFIVTVLTETYHVLEFVAPNLLKVITGERVKS